MTASLVLIVEDDFKIAAVLRDYLEASGFQAEIVADGRAAVEAVRELNPACVLLDLNLPRLDGIRVCDEVRRFSSVPIAMVTARIDEIDRLLGLDIGADDYICKPFSPREVVARVRVLLRRGTSAPLPATAAGPQLDADSRRITLDGRVLEFTTAEYRLLSTLLARPGHVFARRQLVEPYEGGEDPGNRTVDSHVRNLRRKLQASGVRCGEIRSVYGAGYAWEHLG